MRRIIECLTSSTFILEQPNDFHFVLALSGPRSATAVRHGSSECSYGSPPCFDTEIVYQLT